MKTILVCTWLIGMATAASAQSVVQVEVNSAEDTTWETYFWSGLALGITAGGTGWIFRLVRQSAHQNPEI